VTRDAATPGYQLYNGACVSALAAAASEDARQREARAAQALVLLRRAREAGFFKDPGAVEHLKKDAGLQALRPREEFKKFVGEVEAAAKR
jgi:hypothetical protein